MRIISENKNTTNKCRCFLKSSFVRVKRLFVLAYLNQDNKAIKPENIIYQNVLLRIITSSSTERTFMANQLILIKIDTKK